jgi:hypothetical protein
MSGYADRAGVFVDEAARCTEPAIEATLRWAPRTYVGLTGRTDLFSRHDQF